jgi:hypothetical protein
MSLSSERPAVVRTLVVALALGCSGPDQPAPERLTRVDDMERESSQIPWQAPSVGGDVVAGRWQSFADVSCENLSPHPTSPDADRFTFEDVPTPYRTFAGAISTRAARLRTTDALVNTWGAGMRFDLTSLVESVDPSDEFPEDLPCPTAKRDLSEWPAETVDLSGYSGVTFFAKADPGAGPTAIHMMLLDQNSDPRGMVCDPTQGSATECFNSFSMPVEATADFRRFQVAFSELEQDPQWGYRPMPSVPDLEHVYGIAFQVFTPGGVCPDGAVCPGDPPTLSFDIWIDDVHFVNR